MKIAILYIWTILSQYEKVRVHKYIFDSQGLDDLEERALNRFVPFEWEERAEYPEYDQQREKYSGFYIRAFTTLADRLGIEVILREEEPNPETARRRRITRDKFEFTDYRYGEPEF